jgi:predicted nucleic acid-binding protein
MIVVDASVVAELLVELPRAARIRERLAQAGGDEADLAAPHLLDAEVGQVLRRWVLHGQLRAARAEAALDDLADLPIQRHDHRPLLRRAFALRENASFYDALYLALAEVLDAALLTCDGGQAEVPGTTARIERI